MYSDNDSFVVFFVRTINLFIMGGHDAGSQQQFTGIAKYFNSYTNVGRRNVSHYVTASLKGVLNHHLLCHFNILLLFSVCFGHIWQCSSHLSFL